MSVSLTDFGDWASKRETLFPANYNFWAWEDAYEKAGLLLKTLEMYFLPEAFRLLYYNLALHYCITADFEYNGTQNPLYTKYSIADKGKGMVSHASDASSSATMVVTDAMQNLDFLGQDLVSTPYGRYAYGILSSVNIIPVEL